MSLTHYMNIIARTPSDLELAFNQLHWAIASLRKTRKDKKQPAPIVAVSLPQYRRKMVETNSDIPHGYSTTGLVLRIMAPNEKDIEELKLISRLDIADVVALVSPIELIPSEISHHAIVARFRGASPSRMRREARIAFEKGRFGSLEEANKAVNHSRSQNAIRNRLSFTYPFLWVQSTSTKQKLPFTIRVENVEKAKSGVYSSYGMSLDGATIPVF